jgi:hypothetical protein
MCTVSWSVAADGYDLFFNRDELNARAPESPPEASWRDGVAYIAPRDGARGGTWLAANECGLTVCLLNDYGATWKPADPGPRASRGHVVSVCAGASRISEVEAIARACPLRVTLPFHLVALAPGEGAAAWHWQGCDLVRRHPASLAPVLTSSSFSTATVIAERLETYAAVVGHANASPDRLAAYHRQHDARRGAFSVLMRRPDAATRSLIHVRVTAEKVRLGYEPVRWSADGRMETKRTALELLRQTRPAARAVTTTR